MYYNSLLLNFIDWITEQTDRFHFPYFDVETP